MENISVLCIENQISGLCIFYRNLGSVLCLVFCHSRQIIAILLINALHKTGTVRSVCQAGTAPYIWISNKLRGKFHNGLSHFPTRNTGFNGSQGVITGLIFFWIHLNLCCGISILAVLFYLCFYCFFHIEIFTAYKSTDITGFYVHPILAFFCNNINQTSPFQRSYNTTVCSLSFSHIEQTCC